MSDLSFMSDRSTTDELSSEGSEHQVPAFVHSQLVKTELCKFHMTRGCRHGKKCTFAHGVDDLRQSPNFTKTKLCQRLSNCRDKSCRFAHHVSELRSTTAMYKTVRCNFELNGHCALGDQCRHLHAKDMHPSELDKVPVETFVNHFQRVDQGQNYMPAAPVNHFRKAEDGANLEFTTRSARPAAKKNQKKKQDADLVFGPPPGLEGPPGLDDVFFCPPCRADEDLGMMKPTVQSEPVPQAAEQIDVFVADPFQLLRPEFAEQLKRQFLQSVNANEIQAQRVPYPDQFESRPRQQKKKQQFQQEQQTWPQVQSTAVQQQMPAPRHPVQVLHQQQFGKMLEVPNQRQLTKVPVERFMHFDVVARPAGLDMTGSKLVYAEVSSDDHDDFFV